MVHLWVEGFFEVFATDGHRLLLHAAESDPAAASAAAAALLSATIFLSGGIIGTCHHLYFSGTPTVALALGLGVQRAGGRAAGAGRLRCDGRPAAVARRRRGCSSYKWPIYFFVAVAFWNMVGAGLFGFMINPPIALYYMQGLNTTPLHGHAALFGVYGMLGIGLMLVCLRGADSRRRMEGRPAAVLVLGDERRPDGDVRAQPAAGRPDADLGLGRARLLVRPQPRVHAERTHADASAGCACRRHDLRGGRDRAGPVRHRPAHGRISRRGALPRWYCAGTAARPGH